MSDTPETWRQAIEQILAEIAADPKSRLLRTPSVESALSLVDQGAVGVMAPSLTKAERYLLETHREELAFLLRERCVLRFFGDPVGCLRFHRSLTVRQELILPSASDWRRRAVRASGTDLDDVRSQHAVDVLTRCVEVAPGVSSGVDELAASSLKLVGSESAQFYLAANRQGGTGDTEAREMYTDLLHSTRSELVKSLCWEGIGFAYYAAGRYHDAASAYQSSAESHQGRVSPVLFWLTSAAAADDRSLEAAVDCVEASVPPGHFMVDWLENVLRQRAKPLRATRAPKLPARTGEISARLFDAIWP